LGVPHTVSVTLPVAVWAQSPRVESRNVGTDEGASAHTSQRRFAARERSGVVTVVLRARFQQRVVPLASSEPTPLHSLLLRKTPR